MKKISFILDETGSMFPNRNIVVSAYNEYVKSLQDFSKKMRFTLTRFNSQNTRVTLENVKVKNVPMLDDYNPNWTTPLYDAIGMTIRSLERQEKPKDKILVVIQTDGYENASREFTRDDIFKLIDEKKSEGWEFVFMGANIDAYTASADLGISRGNTVQFATPDSAKVFTRTAQATISYFKGDSASGSFYD